MIKKVLPVIFSLGLFCSLFAWNARVNSMGGLGILTDISNIYGIPAYVNDYEDVLQLTSLGAGSSVQFGPAIGIKSIGKYVNLGLYVPTSTVLRSNFYDDSKQYLSSIFLRTQFPIFGQMFNRTQSGLDSFPRLPHLLFGLDFGKVTIGVDAFYEYMSKKIDIDSMNNMHIATDRYIQNPGAKLSININLDPVFISPVVGYGVPSMKGSWVRRVAKANFYFMDTTLRNANGDYTDTLGSGIDEAITKNASSINGKWYLAGSELWCKIAKINFVLGGFWTQENYDMKADSLKIDTTYMLADSTYKYLLYNQVIGSAKFTNQFVDAYFGFNADVYDGLSLTGLYSLTWVKKTRIGKQLIAGSYGGAGSYLPIDESLDALYHYFALGIEKPLAGFWRIDRFVPRAGIKWTLSNVMSRRLSSYQELSSLSEGKFLVTKSEHNPDIATMPSLTAGLGLVAGVFRLDTRVELGQWSGILSGPLGVEGTLTLDFKAFPKPAAKKPAIVPQAPVVEPAEKKAETVSEPAPSPKPEEKQEVKAASEPAAAQEVKSAEKPAVEPAAAQAKPAEKTAAEPAAAPASTETKKAPAAAPASAETKKAPAAAPAPAKTEKKPQ